MAGIIICFQVRGFDLEHEILAIQNSVSTGDLTNASQLIAAALKAHPGEGGLFNLRGIVHAQRNELPDARADFEKAVQLSPGLTAAWQNLGRACQIAPLQNTAAMTCAVHAWQRVLRSDPSNAEAHSSLAKVYEQQAKYADSLREISGLSAAEAQETANVALRCADLAALGKDSEARSAARVVAERADFSEQDWLSVHDAFASAGAAPLAVILITSLDVRGAAGLESLRDLALAYEHSQQPQQARQTLERVAILDPKNPSHLLELARLAEQSKDYEGALGYLAHARDLEPKNAQIHFLFAMVASEMNLPVEARTSLIKALAIDPDNPTYNYALGFITLSTRDAASAGNYFQKFVNARPKEAKGHYALGIAYFASGDYAKSKEEMQRVKDDPKTAGGAEYFLGRIARREDDLQAAEQHLRRSIELLPTYAETRTELARVYLLQGKFVDARTKLDEALRLDPSSFEANEQLLVLYRRTHDSAATQQAELLKELDADRSKRAELMLRSIEFRP